MKQEVLRHKREYLGDFFAVLFAPFLLLQLFFVAFVIVFVGSGMLEKLSRRWNDIDESDRLPPARLLSSKDRLDLN